MPITAIKPTLTPRDPLAQARRVDAEIQSGATPLTLEPKRPGPGILESWTAHAGTNWLRGVTDEAYKLSSGYKRSDPTFNAFSFIKGRPELDNDPIVRELVKRGQFDSSNSMDEFWYDLNAGRDVMNDMRTLSEVGIGGQIALGIASPENFIPLGAAANWAGKGVTLGQTALRGAALGAGTNLAIKLGTNATLPATNEPGFLDEAIDTGFGAGAGAGFGVMGHLLSPRLGVAVRAFDRQKVSDLKNAMIRTEIEARQSFGPGAAKQSDPSLQFGYGQDISAKLKESAADGTARLDDLLKTAPVDHTHVNVLDDGPGGVNRAKLDALKAKYQSAGLSLHESAHPQQWAYDLMQRADRLLDSAGMTVEASAADLGYGPIDSFVSTVASAVARQVSRVTPGGRLNARAQSMVFGGRIQDALRLLSASEQTVTRGSATDPLNFEVGTSAEQVRRQYQKFSSRTLTQINRDFDNACQSDQMARSMSQSDYRRAVVDYARLRQAKADGLIAQIPEAPAFIVKGADRAKAYLNQMADDMEGVGMLATGPRAVAKAKADLDAEVPGTAAHAAAQDRLNTITQSVAKGRDYFMQVWNTQEITGNQQGFARQLSRSFAQQDATGPNGLIPEAQRPLHFGGADAIPAAELRALAASKLGRALTDTDNPLEIVRVGDLPAPLRDAYDAKLQGYYTQAAAETMGKILGDEGDHGVTGALTKLPDHLKARVLRVNPDEFSDFMINDLESMMLHYDYALSGHLAIRKSIQSDPATWSSAKLADGTRVTDVDSLKAYLNEALEGNIRLAGLQDAADGTLAGSSKSKVAAAQEIAEQVRKDMFIPMDEIAGRKAFNAPFAWLEYSSNIAASLSYTNKLGSALWAQMSDIAPAAVHMMTEPKTAIAMTKMVRGLTALKELPDLDALGLTFDNLFRAHAFSEIDPISIGLGYGRTRKVTARVQQGIVTIGDVFSKVTGLEAFTNWQKRTAGLIVLNQSVTGARKIARLGEAFDTLRTLTTQPDSVMAGALRKAGVTALEAAQANQLGLNRVNAARYLDLLYTHGDVRVKGEWKPISSVIDRDSFLRGDRNQAIDKGLTRANFSKWDRDVSTAKGQANADLYDRLTANIAQRVERQFVVTPGLFDRPLINRGPLGRLFNQFQSFLMAFSNQRLRVMAQLPATSQLTYMMTYLAMGAMSKAIADATSGRRSFEETADTWSQNPAAMFYESWARSGLSSWLERPLAVADAMGVPYSPGSLTGANPNLTSARHITPGESLTLLGPAFSDADKAARVGFDLLAGRPSQSTAYNAWRLTPGQNLVWLRLLHQTTGAPVVPEAIKPMPKADSKRPAFTP